jgi:hypothetical protein
MDAMHSGIVYGAKLGFIEMMAATPALVDTATVRI